MDSAVNGSALNAFQAHLQACGGRVGDAEIPLAVDVLCEYLASGAAVGRGLREVLAQLRPEGERAAALVYLFVLTIDAATHRGREGPLLAYAKSGGPLAEVAERLYGMLTSDNFREQTGIRPLHGGLRGCQVRPE